MSCFLSRDTLIRRLTVSSSKFVVDNEWTIDPNAPQERDGSSNINNVLTPEHIRTSALSSSEPATSDMSGANSQPAAAGSASSVPKDTPSGQALDLDRPGFPGAFPETPANERTEFSVNPIPATFGAGNPINLAPGEKVPDPSTLTSNTISSTARDDTSLAKKGDDSEQTFGVSPLPATSGIGNPVQLEPGEKLPPPSSFTQNTLNTFVTTDKESYERGSGPPQLPPVVTPQKERDNRGKSLFDLPPVSGSMIPESSLPIFGASNEEQDPGVTIQSVGPDSSTAALAGQVPLEPRGVPVVIPQDEGSSNQDRDSALRNQTSGSIQGTPASAGEVLSEPRADETLSKGRDPDITIQSVGPSSSTAKLAGEVPLEPPSSRRGFPDSRQGDENPEADGSEDVTIQSVGADSTTAGLAGNVPFETRSLPKASPENPRQLKERDQNGPDDVTIQSVGPESTTAGLAGNVPLEPREPSRGASGNPQHLDEREGSKLGNVTVQSVGANATTAALAGNVPLEPRDLPRGVSENQQQPDERQRGRSDDVTVQSVGANATTSGLAGNVPLEPRSSPGNPHEANQIGDDTQGGRSGNVFIQSTGADATTAGLAGNVPLEPRGVPEIVQESQQTAGFAPEASANPEALREKAALEEELESKVAKEPATSEGIGSSDTAAGGTSLAEKPSTGSTSLPSRGLPTSILQSIDEINRASAKDSTTSDVTSGSASGGNQGIAIAPTVPDVVQESIEKSHQSPEAAASAIVVEEKKAVESELLKLVKPEEAFGEPAPSTSAALSETAPGPTASAKIGQVGNTGVSAVDPTLRVPAKEATEAAGPNRHDSRDISPMSHPVAGLQRGSRPVPQLSSEAVSSTAPAASSSVPAGAASSSTPQKSRAEPVRGSSGTNSSQAKSEASASSDRKSKRASGFFGKLKSKFSHKD